MKQFILPAIVLSMAISSGVSARDDRNRYPIDEAMNLEVAREKLDKGYKFMFGSAGEAAVQTNHGEFMSNKKTNAVGKSDEFACQWAFLSAMLSFQDRIAQEGGNAVINLKSYYKKNEFVSETEFECGNGAIIAGVTFVGDVVTLAE